MLLCLVGILVRIDRIYFKRNHSFSIRFIYPSISPNPNWDLPELSQTEEKILEEISHQKFYYLAKGCHIYAFVSEDGKYVIKFHRFASHMRKFSWINHPFSYLFNERRKKIKEHNIAKLHENMTSYKNSYLDLKDECGLLYLHINPRRHLHQTITLVDATHAQYQVSLSKTSFILQQRANLIYPTLEKLLKEKKIEEAKKVVSDVIQLILTCCKKGYVDEDPILHKNYGLLADRAIHIDIGDLVKRESISLKENYIPHLKEMTQNMRKRLKNEFPELLDHYDHQIQAIQ